MADLMVLAGGKPLGVKGLAFIKGLKLKELEGEEIPAPVLPRVIILEVIGYEFHQKLAQMVEQLFCRPYSPSDTFSIVTPAGVYSFSSDSLRTRLPDELMRAASTILKRDLPASGATEVEIIQELTRLVQELQQGSPPREILRQYQQNLDNLNNHRKFNADPIMAAASHFSKARAIKHYVIVYQQEFVPIRGADMMEKLLANQSVMFQASELFRSIAADTSVEVDPLAEEMKKARLIVNFIYFKVSPRPRPDIQLRELSTDKFELYSRLASLSGGLAVSSTSPEAQLEKILESTENYYLIS